MKFRSFVMLAVVLCAVSAGVKADSLGPIYRLSADFQYGPPPERGSITTAGANGTGGTLIYSKTLFVPRRTVFVTFHATASVHHGAVLLMACLVDGVPCRPEPSEPGYPPSGWIRLQNLPAPVNSTNCDDGDGGSGDCHDNNVTYSWCTNVRPGVHTIDLRLASSVAGVAVFTQKAHIYIDNAGNRGWDDDDDDDDDRDDRQAGCAADTTPAVTF